MRANDLTRRAFIRTALVAGTVMVVGVSTARSAVAQLRPIPDPVVPPEVRRPPFKLPADPAFRIESYFGPTTAYLTRDWVFKAVGAPQGAALVWSGTGTFQNHLPGTVKAAFRAVGKNTISVAYTVAGVTRSASLELVAKDADNYARVGGTARAVCAHGCPACPHPVVGPIISGSSTYNLDGRPIACVGDRGTHVACCGPNTFVISTGDSEVLVDGKAAARIGDVTTHCGGKGTIVTR